MHVMEVHAYHGLRSSLRAFYRARSRSSPMSHRASPLPPLAVSHLRRFIKCKYVETLKGEGRKRESRPAMYMESG